MVNFIIGILVGIITQWIVLLLKRARLKIKVEPTYEWFVDDKYFPCLRVFISNIGHTRTEIVKTIIEFKNGSEIYQEDLQYFQSITVVEPKSTASLKFNEISKLIDKRHFHQTRLFRIKMVTIDDKVFLSKWYDTVEALKIWKLIQT